MAGSLPEALLREALAIRRIEGSTRERFDQELVSKDSLKNPNAVGECRGMSPVIGASGSRGWSSVRRLFTSHFGCRGERPLDIRMDCRYPKRVKKLYHGRFRVEVLEARVVPSSVAITFDPAGTFVKDKGTIDGETFIQVKTKGGGSTDFGVPGVGGGVGGGGNNSGKAIVFATDLDEDGVVDPNEVTGIALGDELKVTIYGSVHGDIVTNLTKSELSGDAKDGSLLETHSIEQLDVRGSVFGDIIAGRSINRVSIDGSVENIYSGPAASGVSFRFWGPDGPSVALQEFTLSNNTKGGSLRDIEIGMGVVGIYASDGGPGGNGGSIRGLSIESDPDGVIIQSGRGGSDVQRSGGDGGDFDKVEVNSGGPVTLIAGDGGDSERDGGAGGNGGNLFSVVVNSDAAVILTAGEGGDVTGANSNGGWGGAIEKAGVTAENLTLRAGHAGDGSKTGGEGGSVIRLKGSIGGEASFFAGHGGNSDGEAGLGGSVAGLKLTPSDPDALVRAIVAGNGGSGFVTNGEGGSVSGVKFAGDLGDFLQSYGVAGMGGIFAGRAGLNPNGEPADNGDVTGIKVDRIAAIVAGSDLTELFPRAVNSIQGIKATAIGANFDTSGDDEPAFDFLESVNINVLFDVGEIVVDGPVLAHKAGKLGVTPLFLFVLSTNLQIGTLDPQ